MESQNIPKNFIIGTREDYILRNRSIAATERMENELANACSSSSAHTYTPPNTPCFPEDATSHKDLQNISNSAHVEPPAALLQTWKDIVRRYHGENERLRDEILKLEVQNNNLIDAKHQRERMSKDPRESTIYTLLQQLSEASQQIQSLKKDLGFTKLKGLYQTRLTELQISTFMNKISEEVQNLMHDHEISWHPNIFAIKEEADLKELLFPVFGHSSLSKAKTCFAAFGPQLVVQALALAAVREWVFMSRFPYFEQNELSETHMRMMLTKGDWKSAHNLALASYNHLIREPRFKQIDVPERTLALAKRFLKAVRPLFNSPHNNEVILEKMWLGENSRVSALFKTALMFKANTVMTDQNYEFVVKLPGTSQKEESEKQSGEHASSQSWQCATLYLYESEISSPRDVLGDASIQLRNFISKDPDMREVGSSLKVPLTIPRDKLHENMNTFGQHKVSLPVYDTESLSSLSDAPSENSPIQPDEGFLRLNLLDEKNCTQTRCSDPLEGIAVKQMTVSQCNKKQHDNMSQQAIGATSPIAHTKRRKSNRLNIHEVDTITIASPMRKEDKHAESKTKKNGSLSNERRQGPPRNTCNCNKCGLTFATLSGLTQHQKWQSCKQCSSCDQWFSKKAFSNHGKGCLSKMANSKQISQANQNGEREVPVILESKANPPDNQDKGEIASSQKKQSPIEGWKCAECLVDFSTMKTRDAHIKQGKCANPGTSKRDLRPSRGSKPSSMNNTPLTAGSKRKFIDDRTQNDPAEDAFVAKEPTFNEQPQDMHPNKSRRLDSRPRVYSTKESNAIVSVDVISNDGTSKSSKDMNCMPNHDPDKAASGKMTDIDELGSAGTSEIDFSSQVEMEFQSPMEGSTNLGLDLCYDLSYLEQLSIGDFLRDPSFQNYPHPQDMTHPMNYDSFQPNYPDRSQALLTQWPYGSCQDNGRRKSSS